MRDILIICGAATVAIVVHVLTMAGVGRLFRIDVDSIRIFFGPPILTLGRLHIGAIPSGGFVKFRAPVDGDAPEALIRCLDRRSPAVALAIHLSGCAALVALATTLLGTVGLEEFCAGFRQLVEGGLGPRTEGARLIGAFGSLVHENGLAAVLGVIAAKFAAMNLLPLPLLNGGEALRSLGALCGLPRNWPALAPMLSLLVMLVLLVSWCVALGSYWLL